MGSLRFICVEEIEIINMLKVYFLDILENIQY